MRHTLKYRWGLASASDEAKTEKAAPAIEERTRSRKQVAMAFGVDPERAVAEDATARVKKRAKVVGVLSQRIGLKTAHSEKRSMTAGDRLLRALGGNPA